MLGEPVNKSLAAPQSLSLTALRLTALYYSQGFGCVAPCQQWSNTGSVQAGPGEGRDRGRRGVLSRFAHGEKYDLDRDGSHWPSSAFAISRRIFLAQNIFGAL